MNLLIKLPSDCLNTILKYLHNKEKILLLNSLSKSLHEYMRIYINVRILLNSEPTYRYLTDSIFREWIDKRYNKKQLNMYINLKDHRTKFHNYYPKPNYKIMPDLYHTINLINKNNIVKDVDFSFLNGINKLILDGCTNTIKISLLKFIDTLELIFDYDFSIDNTINFNQGINNYYNNLIDNYFNQEINNNFNQEISNDFNEEINTLGTGTIRHLIIVNCDYISDVSGLGTISILTLKNCKNVRDISALKSVQTLELIGCENII